MISISSIRSIRSVRSLDLKATHIIAGAISRRDVVLSSLTQTNHVCWEAQAIGSSRIFFPSGAH